MEGSGAVFLETQATKGIEASSDLGRVTSKEGRENNWFFRQLILDTGLGNWHNLG